MMALATLVVGMENLSLPLKMRRSVRLPVRRLSHVHQ
jgi:hypothetical protein